MLTRKQFELLQFIDQHVSAHGVPPSYDEMKVALALKSKSGIHRLITGLEERGFIRRLPHRARALEIIRRPDTPGQQPETSAKSPSRAGESEALEGFAPRVIRGDFTRALPGVEGPEDGGDGGGETITVPLLGRIAAGTPIEALRDPSAYYPVPAGLVGTGEHYALSVEGDSMRDAGILDGDVVVISRCETADNGAIVVALVDDHEVALKRLRRHGQSIALEPANPAYETRIFPPHRVKVQGRLRALVREY